MNNENNSENTMTSLEEVPVTNNQENSGNNEIEIEKKDDFKKEEIPKEFRAVEHKTEEIHTENFDASVYYSSNVDENNVDAQKTSSTNDTSTTNQGDRRMSLFGSSIRQMKLPKITSKEEARKVFFGQSISYYERYYAKLQQQKKKLSWNWAAFFMNVYWFFSRKMYVYGFLTMVCKAMFTLVGFNLYDNMSDPMMQSFLVPWAILYLAVDVIIGLFANYLYISHMESKIVYPGESQLGNEELVKVIVMRGGFTMSGVLLCFFLSDLVLYGLQYLMTLV